MRTTHQFRYYTLAILLSVLVALAFIPTPVFATSDTSYIGITSDVHGTTGNVATWLENNGDSLSYMVFCGDYDNAWNTTTITTLKNIVTNKGITPVFTMGNHDWMSGSESAFSTATGNTRTGVQNNPAADGYTIYTLGASSSGINNNFFSEDIDALQSALETSDQSEPFFIASHYPLHLGEGRTASSGQYTTNLQRLISLLNDYPNVIFFWGHNHHWGYSGTDMLNTIKVAGDEITPAVSGGTPVEINFTYCNAGHMGDETGQTLDQRGTGVRVAITKDGANTTVSLEIKRMAGTTITSKSVDISSSDEIARVALTGIMSPRGGDTPDTDAVASSGVLSPVTVAWYEGDTPLSEGDTFTAGTVYTAVMELFATGSKVFTEATTVTVNGEEATVESFSEEKLTVSFTFPLAPGPSPTYIKAASIIDGHEYVIVDGGVAMNTTSKTGSTSSFDYEGLGYTTPTIRGDTLTFASSEEAAEATWIFTSAGPDGQWYISNGSSYVYAPEARVLQLSSTEKTPWTYADLNNAKQIYASLDDPNTKATANCKLFYGNGSTVDFFYPTVNNNGNIVLYEKAKPVERIEVEFTATKTSYYEGERFDPAGLVVTAHYTDGISVEVTGYTYSPDGPLSLSDTSVTISYAGKTALVPITVSAAPPTYVYKKVTEITSGKEYAVVLDCVAMKNVTATGSYSSNSYTGFVYTTPTIKGDYLFFDSIADALASTWTLTDDGNGQWYIYNNGYVNAPANRTVALSDTPQAWTYDNLGSYGKQLYVKISSSNYNLYCGKGSTVDLIYPSANNHNTLALYEKLGVLEQISITTPPAKTIYAAGESFSRTGMVVTATFSDGSKVEIDGYEVSPKDALAMTDEQVTVIFMGKTATLPIYVFPAGDLSYEKVDTIEASATYVIVSDINGTTRALQNKVANSNYLAGTSVAVSDDTITSSVSSDMLWTAEQGSTGMCFQNDGAYLTRGSSSSSGYRLVAGSKPGDTYGDWFYSSSDRRFYVTGTSGSKYYLYYSSQNYFRANSTPGSNEEIYLFKRFASPVTLESITVDTSGVKTSYTVGQAFDPTGMVVTAHFSNGISNNVTNYTYSPAGPLSTEDTTVTVSYCGKTAVINITVNSEQTEPDNTAPEIEDGTITASDITETGVTLSWNKATDNESAQGALQYLVYQSGSNNIDTVENIEANGNPVGTYETDINSKEITGLSSGTTYYFNVIVKDEAGNKAAYNTVEVTTAAAQLPVMGGSVVIVGEPKYGGTLTANISGLTYTPDTKDDVPTYQWKRGEVAIEGAESSEYTLSKEDIGKRISVTVTADGINATGSVTSEATAAVEKADGPAAPEKPELVSKTHNSVTLQYVEGQEYSVDGGTWQESSVFEGLSPDTEYTFTTRIKETTTHKASAASEGIIVKTDKSPGSLVVNKSGDNLPTGTNVTLTATATGIDKPVYEYWVKSPRDDTWTCREYSSDPDYTFTQAVPGTYTIYTYCKGVDEPYSSAIIADPVTVTFTNDKTVCALTVDGPSGNQPPDGSATFSATATDHGGNPLYQFWVHDNSGWRVAQDYSTNNTFTMENLKCGSYTVAAYALDESDVRAGNWGAAYVKAFVINVNSSVSLYAPANVSPGGKVNLTAEAECLTGVEYQFWYQTPDGTWHSSGAYTTNNIYSFTAATSGTYKVIVYAKDHYAPATDQFAVWDIKTINCP
jgi:hypothetical protein